METMGYILNELMSMADILETGQYSKTTNTAKSYKEQDIMS